MTGEIAGSDFWRFSLKFYGRPEVRDMCLLLQEANAADVNIILYLFYIGGERRVLAAESILDLVEFVETWRKNVVLPMRQIRRKLDDGVYLGQGSAETYRQRIMGAEIEAERLQQEAMFERGKSFVFRENTPILAAKGNLSGYEAVLGHSLQIKARTDLLVAFSEHANGVSDP